MTRHAYSAIFALALGATACFDFFDPQPRSDGEACDQDDQCRSERCHGGMCTGSSCDIDGDCVAGFRCAEPGRLVEVLTLGAAKGSCVPTCEACPDDGRWACTGNACSCDDAPFVDAGGPYTAVVGETVRLVGSAEPAPGRNVESAVWSTWEVGELGHGLEAEVVFTTPGIHTVALLVTDDDSASGTAHAEVDACSPVDGPCGNDHDCCDEAMVCSLATGTSEWRCAAPH
jgi:hypothetical protein